MALFAHVVGGVFLYAGELPVRARRLDTNEVVDPARWLEACGFYDVASFDPAAIPGLTAGQRDQLAVDVAAASVRQGHRDVLVGKVHTLVDLARDRNWDWIDKYCHGTVKDFPFVLEQSPNAGIDWPALSAFGEAEVLRLGVSLCLVENIRIALAVDMIVDVLADLIDGTDVDPGVGDR